MDYDKLYPFWQYLSEEEKKAVEQACYHERYQAGLVMHRAEENCKGLMTILSGRLRTYILSEEGREVTLFRIPAGEVCVLSASCLMDAIDFDVQIEALEDTEVIVLPSHCLNRIIKTNMQVELYLYKTTVERFSQVMWTMQQILFQKIDQRVAQYLWDEMVRTKEMEIRNTHDEIARYIGSAREVVSKILKYLEEAKAVSLKRGKIIILDKDKLKKYL